MKVYAVQTGEDYEGGYVIALFATLELAKRYVDAKLIIDSYDGRDKWEVIEASREDYFKWHRGCDWLEICEMQVHSE